MTTPPEAADAIEDADEVWLTPGVAGIGTASLLSDLGHEVPTSLLPSFLTSTLGAPASALGLIEGVSDALSGVAKVGGGALADEPDRRRAVAVGGYTTTAVLSAGIGAATGVWQVALLRAGAWTARGLRVPSRNALLADAVPRRAYGRAYGFERAMDNLGAIFGPLLAIGLVTLVGVRWAIGLSVVPGLLAAVAIVYAIRHTPRAERVERQPLRIRIRPVLVGDLRAVFAGITAFEVGNCAATLLILRATELFEPTHGKSGATTLALWLYVAYNVTATAVSPLAGRQTDRLGALRVLMVGVGAFAVAYLAFAHERGRWLPLLGAFVVAGVGIACVETAEHAVVALRAPERLRGSAFGLLAGIQSFGNLAASAVAGILWTALSPTWAFTYLGAAMVVALGAFVAVHPDFWKLRVRS
jgi:MFS family permease